MLTNISIDWITVSKYFFKKKLILEVIVIDYI